MEQEEKKIYPELLKEVLKELGVPENELEQTIESLTFSFIALL